MPDPLIGFGLLAFSGIAGWSAVRGEWQRKLMAKLPTTPIRRARTGLVELKGQVVPLHEPMRAPMSGQLCVWYRFSVQEEFRDKRRHHKWVTIASGREEHDFLIEDETGRAIVRPKGAEFFLDDELHGVTALLNRADDRAIDAMRRVGVKADGFFGRMRNLRYVERLIPPGEELYVIGRARPCGQVEAQGSGATVVIDRKGSDFLISDKNEEKLSSHLATGSWFSGILAMLFFLGALAWMVAGPG